MDWRGAAATDVGVYRGQEGGAVRRGGRGGAGALGGHDGRAVRRGPREPVGLRPVGAEAAEVEVVRRAGAGAVEGGVGRGAVEGRRRGRGRHTWRQGLPAGRHVSRKGARGL